jgi:hypothetical protein
VRYSLHQTRKLLQDLVTPDLKALEARVVALEQKMDLKFEHIDKKIDAKFETLDKKIDFKHDLLSADIRNVTTMMAANHAAVMHILD